MSAGYYTVDGRRTTLSKMLADNAHDPGTQREIHEAFAFAKQRRGVGLIGGGAAATFEVLWHDDEHAEHVADGERDRDCPRCV